MQIIISGHRVTLTPAFRQAVERKVGKLARLLPKIREARVRLSAEKYRRTARLTLAAKRRVFRSEETAGDLAAAVDLAVDALARQVRQEKGRLRRRKGRAASGDAGRAAAAPRPAGEAEPPAPIVVTRRLMPKPMSVEEAAMQLGLRDDQFLVFTNAATERVNVLYRRKSGGLGLIEPVA
jgi:putative sigma-54 modulation protein